MMAFIGFVLLSGVVSIIAIALCMINAPSGDDHD